MVSNPFEFPDLGTALTILFDCKVFKLKNNYKPEREQKNRDWCWKKMILKLKNYLNGKPGFDLNFKKSNESPDVNPFYRSVYLYDNGELGNLSLTGFNVEISRHYSEYVIVYYLPSGLFVMVSWTSFIIPPGVNIHSSFLQP